MKRKKVSRVVWIMLLAVAIVSWIKPGEAWSKKLKVGVLLSFEYPLGIQCKRELDAVVPAFNKRGGLTINGEKYTIDLIVYNSGPSQFSVGHTRYSGMD